MLGVKEAGQGQERGFSHGSGMEVGVRWACITVDDAADAGLEWRY